MKRKVMTELAVDDLLSLDPQKDDACLLYGLSESDSVGRSIKIPDIKNGGSNDRLSGRRLDDDVGR